MDIRKQTRILLAMIVFAFASGCTWLMKADFDNSREIATLDIGVVQSATATMTLPPGDASISFVVPGYDCKHPLDGIIDIVIRGTKGEIKQETLNLNKLTWPKVGNGECFPIGYWALDDINVSRPLEFMIDNEVSPITIELNMTHPASLSRSMSVWVVYNSRLPVERMLGKVR